MKGGARRPEQASSNVPSLMCMQRYCVPPSPPSGAFSISSCLALAGGGCHNGSPKLRSDRRAGRKSGEAEGLISHYSYSNSSYLQLASVGWRVASIRALVLHLLRSAAQMHR